MRRASVTLALLALAALALPTGAYEYQATPAASALPDAEAPFELGSVILPDGPAGVAALFARLPDKVDGEPRSPTLGAEADRVVASYGVPDAMDSLLLSLQVLDFEKGDFFPRDFTVDQFVASVSENADYGTEAFGQDGALAWVRAESSAGVAGSRPGTPDSVRPIYTLAWGNVGSPLLFSAIAATPNGLEALVKAFVATAGIEPPTSSPVASPAVES